MAVAADQTTVDLSGVVEGGLINEDVSQQILNISSIPLALKDRMGTLSHSNRLFERTLDRLGSPNTTNAVEESSGGRPDESENGIRVNQYTQTSTKTFEVSQAAQSSDTIGRSNELAYQVRKGLQRTMRDIEAITMLNQASLPESNGVASTTGGLEAWLINVDINNSATRVDGSAIENVIDLSTGGITLGGWQFTAGTTVINAHNYAAVTAVNALTEASIRSVAESVWVQGGNPSLLMSRTKQIKGLSAYMFTSSARIATITNDSPTGDADRARVAQGSVNLFVTDFDVTLEMRANRLQQFSGDGSPNSTTLFVLDPSMLNHSFLFNMRVKQLASDGLADKREVQVAWALDPPNWEGQGAVLGLDETATVTA